MVTVNDPRRVCSVWVVTLACIGCGPGDFAFDGGGFGSIGTTTTTETSSGDEPEPLPETESGDGDGDPAETDTETGADDWTNPETETETETGGPEPVPATCERVWTHVDVTETHGHIGATPIADGSDGAFVSVTPVLGAGNDEVNVDAWVRSWSVGGELEWERLISWADHRDDPLVLHDDEFGDLYVGGRIDANMQTENAMISALDGYNGEIKWTKTRGEGGGYTSLAYNGAAVVAAGYIGDFEQHRLELVALDPDNGTELWSAAPDLELIDVATRGLSFDDGVIDVLVAEAADFGSVSIQRFEPPGESASLLATLVEFDEDLLPSDLERFGPDSLLALYSVGTRSFLAKVARDDGELEITLALDELDIATEVLATELAVTPTGVAVAGMATGDDGEAKTFIAHLDDQLELVCFGVLGKADLSGVYHPPQLRGLAVGPGLELVTGSYVVNGRKAVFARWQ